MHNHFTFASKTEAARLHLVRQVYEPSCTAMGNTNSIRTISELRILNQLLRNTKLPVFEGIHCVLRQKSSFIVVKIEKIELSDYDIQKCRSL